MTEEKPKRRRNRRNAFERARDATLAFDTGWWTSLAGAGLSEIDFSPPQFIQLGDDAAVIGGMVLDRRIVTYRVSEEDEEQTEVITRPVMTRFSALPISLLERIARDLLALADAEWREANIEAVVTTARSFGENERFDLARDILGPEASEEELAAFADQSRMPDAVVAGGEAAAEFFDQYVSTVTLTGEEGEEQIADEPPEPGRTALLTGEWDYYTPEDIDHYGGPEADGAYAFRIVRLCEAIREQPDAAVQLAVHLGAVAREWEMWRENEEFLRAGRAHFAQQSHLAKSRGERPWMTQVRHDLETGRIGDNVAQYARKFARERRHLKPPAVDRIRNFVSELRQASHG
jgi:hypothetical protein